MLSVGIPSSRLPVILCGAFFFLIGLLFAGTGASMWLHDARAIRSLRTEGATAHGTVLRKSIHADRSGGGDDTGFHVSYRFRSPPGNEFTDSAGVTFATWQQLKPGGTVNVVYLPADPAIHRVEGQQQDVMLPAIFGGIGSVFVLIGGLMLVWSLWPPPRVAATVLDALARQPFLTFAGLWLVITTPFLIAGVYLIASQRSVDATFKTQTARATGQVLSKAAVRSSSNSRDGVTTSTSYKVTFRYDAPSGDEVVGSANVDYDAWRRLSERGPIAVTFIADEPWNFRIDGAGTGWGRVLLLFGIGLGGVLIGIGALVVGLTIGRGRSRVEWTQPVSVTHGVPAARPAQHRTGAAGNSALAGAAVTGLSVMPSLSGMGGRRQGWRWLPQAWVIPAVGIIFSTVGITILIWGITMLADERSYAGHGVLAEGHITGKTITRAEQNGNNSTKYILSYRFTTASGETVEGSYAPPVDLWEAVKEGDALSVRFLPDRPHTNRAASEDHAMDGVMATGLGLLFAIVGGGMSVAVTRRAWRLHRLRQSGRLVQGTVLSVEPSGLTINGVGAMGGPL